jgi:hypothetical protein
LIYCVGSLELEYPFGLSLSKPFDKLRANGLKLHDADSIALVRSAEKTGISQHEGTRSRGARRFGFAQQIV